MAGNSPNRRLQFSLRSFLWLILCLLLALGAYRRGYEVGLADRANQRQEVGKQFSAAYAVGDVVPIVPTKTGVIADFDTLISDIHSNVLPRTWTDNGGEAEIAEFAPNLSLVVMHDKDGHQRIAEYLGKLRAKNRVAVK